MRNLCPMIHFKNNDGLSLIEVMLAMTVIALIFTPLFILQGNVLQRVSRMSLRFKRIMQAENLLYKARKEQPINAKEFTLEETDTSGTKYVYTLQPLSKDSRLASLAHVLYVERVIISWQDFGKPYNDTLITYVYKPIQGTE
jgi:prepilin-type N-terminal cleavage/methylation domain-containing protein